MSDFESYCSTLGRPVRLAPGETTRDIVCLDCGSQCTGSTCPVGGVSSAVMTHRLIHSGQHAPSEPLAAECPDCGARTIHDVVAAQFAICRACGTARHYALITSKVRSLK